MGGTIGGTALSGLRISGISKRRIFYGLAVVALFRMRRTYTHDASAYVDAGSTVNGAHTYDFRYAQAGFGPQWGDARLPFLIQDRLPAETIKAFI